MSRQLVHGRTRGGGVGSAFEHLQSIVSSRSSTKSTSNCSIQTKTDAKFDAITHLLLTASRLSSAANVLDEYVKVISSDESSRENQIYLPCETEVVMPSSATAVEFDSHGLLHPSSFAWLSQVKTRPEARPACTYSGATRRRREAKDKR